MDWDNIETSKDIPVSTNPIERIIGQKNAVEKAKLAVQQRRHLLLVGPPGVGKSMLAQALSLQLPKPKEQVSAVQNTINPSRPLIEVKTRQEIESEIVEEGTIYGKIVNPSEVPLFVAERLGYRCPTCGSTSRASENTCPNCGANKYSRITQNQRRSPFGDIITEVFEVYSPEPEQEIQTTHIGKTGKEERIVYQRNNDDTIRLLDKRAIEEIKKKRETTSKNIITPLKRKTFIHATGASETELLGDVRHDPYGSHPEIGTPPHQRVVPGAVHEAHEGVLFIDELPHLKNLQNYILTAMQEKKFPITGRNPQSAGASVKVGDVPCDFLFVGACNMREVGDILPPLRSRIIGNGYEVLLDTTMPDTDENQLLLAQFIAQEIHADGRIPHATKEAIKEIIKDAGNRAKNIDDTRNALTLRLRELGGVVRMAGDFAVLEGADQIEKKHIKRGIMESTSIEHQIRDRYGSVWQGYAREEYGDTSREGAQRGYL